MFNTKRTTSALTLAALGITQGQALETSLSSITNQETNLDSDIWSNYANSYALFAYSSSCDQDYACCY
tara:strand:- start:383 stop:586 length:204 start_codon:yes stop_codon:yes gene_type:complete